MDTLFYVKLVNIFSKNNAYALFPNPGLCTTQKKLRVKNICAYKYIS